MFFDPDSDWKFKVNSAFVSTNCYDRAQLIIKNDI